MSQNSQLVETQARFYQSARQNPKRRFNDVIYRINRADWIATKREGVLRSQGGKTPGVDGKSALEYRSPEAKADLDRAVAEFLRPPYFLPAPMRTVQVPKRTSGTRTIFVPIIRDRIVGHLLTIPLEPIFEADFIESSHGYRRRRRTMNAIDDCRRLICPNQLWVLRADVRNCFPSLKREILFVLLRRRIADEKVIALIDGFIDVQSLSKGFEIGEDGGVPAGWPASPLLMNIYLDAIDQWFVQRCAKSKARVQPAFSRFADNLIFFMQTEREALDLRDELRHFVARELGLSLSQAEICHAAAGFDFLGFHLQWLSRKGHLHVGPSSERIERLKGQISTTILESSSIPIIEINSLLGSFAAEFRYVNSSPAFSALDSWVERKFASVLGAQASQTLSKIHALAQTPRVRFKPFRGNPYC